LRASADKARASFGEGRAPFGAPSRRLYSAGPRFLTGELPPAVSELLAGDRSVPGRSPGAARAPWGAYPHSPQAPHPIPPT